MFSKYTSFIKTFCQLVIYIYGLWFCCVDIATSFLPIGVSLAVIISGAIIIFRIPKPSRIQVDRIVGRDLFYDINDGSALMKTVAHRGAGLDAPENSLNAFKICEEKNCMFIEFDVILTKDQVPVVFHDGTLDRMANESKKICDLTYAELKEIDIAKTHPFWDRFKNTRIPTLDETVRQLLDSKQNMFIDLKNPDLRMVKIINDLFEKYPELHSRAVVTSFFPILIYMIRRNDPEIVCSMAYRPYYFSHISYKYLEGVGPRRAKSFYLHVLLVLLDSIHSWLFTRVTYQFLGLSLILLNKECISPQIVQEWRDRDVRVCVWTANQPNEKQYFSKTLKITYLTDTLVGESTTHLS